jgi:MFS family permease
MEWSPRHSIRERPRAVALRALAALLAVIGLGINVWLLVIVGSGYGWRVALLLMAPAGVLVFAAWLVENTPSMRGCLSIAAVLLAMVGAFWAYVGVTMALDEEASPAAVEGDAETTDAPSSSDSE